MIKTKYLLYAFKQPIGTKYAYWYETDTKYFSSTKPPKKLLDNSQTIEKIDKKNIIDNPWLEWDSSDVQKIVSKKTMFVSTTLDQLRANLLAKKKI